MTSRREIRWRGYDGGDGRNSGGRGCRRRTMNAGELLRRLWPRAPNHVLNIVVLKLSLLFTTRPKSSDVRFLTIAVSKIKRAVVGIDISRILTIRPVIQITHAITNSWLFKRELSSLYNLDLSKRHKVFFAGESRLVKYTLEIVARRKKILKDVST